MILFKCVIWCNHMIHIGVVKVGIQCKVREGGNAIGKQWDIIVSLGTEMNANITNEYEFNSFFAILLNAMTPPSCVTLLVPFLDYITCKEYQVEVNN